MAKNIVDYIADEDYARYNELLNRATELKANAPKAPRKSRGPMTIEEKKAAAAKRLAAAQAKLDALMAAEQEG